MSSAGDFNGDGFGDLIVGQGDEGNQGTAYIVFGKAAGFSASMALWSLDGISGVQLAKTWQVAGFGAAVSGAGDMNGDGFDDVIVGERTSFNGSASVVFGSNYTGAVTFAGTAGADALHAGSALAERFSGGDGNDSMIGGGGADVFHGGAGNDVISIADLLFQLVDGGAGKDTLALSGSGMNLTLASLRGRINDIESIDLTGSGDNALTLSALDLLNLSTSGNRLIVDGNAGDKVYAALGSGFTTGADQTVGGNLYHTYSQGAAVLLVGVNIASGDIVIS